MNNVQHLAKGLGWFSIGSGLAELFASEELEEFLGIENREGLLRFFGAREVAAGIGILTSPKPDAAWLWGRVAGDALDLGALGAALDAPKAKKGNVVFALVAVAGVTLLDIYCARELR